MEKIGSSSCEDNYEVRKGPWTMEEDLILMNYIANNGEGVWNNIAKSAGLKRNGKSCRLRWLNYLRPDVRRGNITPEEELLIIELQSRWGNRWSKIAKQLPGRTDNEIKNYWRTRIQKKVKLSSESYNNYHQLNPEVDHDQNHQIMPFPDTVEYDIGQMKDGVVDHNGIETCSPPVYVDDSSNSEAFTAHSAPAESNYEPFWDVEDIWSMQLFSHG